MILTRKQALEKLKKNFEEKGQVFILSTLMGFYENMSDETLKVVLEKRFNEFILIDAEPNSSRTTN